MNVIKGIEITNLSEEKSMDDIWCDFCNEKMKEVILKHKGKTFHVCKHCASLAIGFEREDEDGFL